MNETKFLVGRYPLESKNAKSPPEANAPEGFWGMKLLDDGGLADELHDLAGQHAAADGGGELSIHILLQLLDGQAVLTGDDGHSLAHLGLDYLI